ncbi:putative Plant self-incompatibility protein S1 family [Melia azedarach]|uniref:Plant self-incompatibility protein S1 family n=1 Tax=Melia azedarach TaxID=155640 RepID=A0ACC1YHD3_MELAZ|nr:putative Plant self-incompatibility protein S1 family [Melia azedarach]
MTTLCHFLLLVFVASCFCFSIGNTIEVNSNHLAQVHIMNALPKGSEPIRIRCTSGNTDVGARELAPGSDYSWSVEERAVYYCGALWTRQIASWHAFQPRRDSKHENIFWLVKENGFFLGWDNSTWVRKSTWETE